MAINFEAANMAGYNNPRIEVFPLSVNDNLEITDAPTTSILSDCINRGSVPFLRITTTDHNTAYILPIAYIQQQTSGLDFGFSAVARSGDAQSATTSVITINYDASTGTPSLFAQVLPSGTT